MQPDDRDLVERAKRGDRDAYAALHDRYAPLVRAICFDATGNLVHSQELAQEVFLRAYQKRLTLRKANRFGLWLIGIARHVGREWHKHRRRDRRVCSGIPSAALAVEPNPKTDCERSIDHASARLPEKQRLVLHLLCLQGRSASEARRILGLSPSGFYTLLARASDRITEILESGE